MNFTASTSGALVRTLHIIIKPALWSAFVLILTNQFVSAGSATWNLNPVTNDWSTAANWTPATVPDGPTDTASFALSKLTDVSISAAIEVDSIRFNSGASGFTIGIQPNQALTISGTEIVNNSGLIQNLVATDDGTGNFGTINFTNNATVGDLIQFTSEGDQAGPFGAEINFFNHPSAGTGTFINNGGRTTFTTIPRRVKALILITGMVLSTVLLPFSILKTPQTRAMEYLLITAATAAV